MAVTPLLPLFSCNFALALSTKVVIPPASAFGGGVNLFGSPSFSALEIYGMGLALRKLHAASQKKFVQDRRGGLQKNRMHGKLPKCSGTMNTVFTRLLRILKRD